MRKAGSMMSVRSRLRHARKALLVLGGAAALVAGTLIAGGAAPAGAATSLPCDIYAAAGTPCVAAHSTTRALYAAYNGPLYACSLDGGAFQRCSSGVRFGVREGTHTLVVRWGEGDPETLRLPADVHTFRLTHQYLDDNPSGTPSDTYAVTVQLTDNDGGTATPSIAAGDAPASPAVSPSRHAIEPLTRTTRAVRPIVHLLAPDCSGSDEPANQHLQCQGCRRADRRTISSGCGGRVRDRRCRLGGN